MPSRLHPATLRIGRGTLSYDPGKEECNFTAWTTPLEKITGMEITGNGKNEIYLNFKVNDTKTYNFKFADHQSYFVAGQKGLAGIVVWGADVMVSEPGAAARLSSIKAILEQRMQERAAVLRERERQEAEKRALPAGLSTTVLYDDSHSILPNNRLDAGKKAELVVAVRNQGPGAAYGVVLSASADQPRVILPGPQQLGEIPPGQSREVRLPIEAGLDLPSGELNVFVEAREKRGYDARKFNLVIPMARLERPSLTIEEPLINDGTKGQARGNGNGIAESGETIELIVLVKNGGQGPSAAATLSLASVDPGIEVLQAQAALGTIQPGQTVQGTLVLSVPRTYARRALNTVLKVSDARGEGVATASRQVALNVQYRAPVLEAAVRILSQGRESQELTNGETFEIEVTPANRGNLDAVGVALRMSAADAVLTKDQMQIGTLRNGEHGMPQRFELTVPRPFAREQLAVRVDLSQKDFPAWTDERNVPVRRRRPALSASSAILGVHGGKAIEQNETADLELRIVNNGTLTAEEVNAQILVNLPGVEVQGPRSVLVGRILPNDTGTARFRLHLLRSVPTGPLPIPMLIAQADFPALNDSFALEVRAEQAQVGRVEPLREVPTALARTIKPVITLPIPNEGEFVRGETFEFVASVVDERGISRIQVSVNGKPIPEETVRQGTRRRAANAGPGRDQVDLRVPVPLQLGPNQVEVVAYNLENESERHTVTVTRLEGRPDRTESAPTLAPLSDVDRFVLEQKGWRPDPRRWAVVIGIEKYRKVADAEFASRDAIAVREYVIRVLGVLPEQVFLLLDDEATSAEIHDLVEDRLPQRVQGGDTVFVYFAGHGMPEVTSYKPYLLPADANPGNLHRTAYSLEDFYEALGKLKAERVAVFLDACFSGLRARSGKKELLVPGTRTVFVTKDQPSISSLNLVSLSAADNSQVSNAYREKAHGLFTYFLLKGLSGSAGASGDRLLLSELAAYVTNQVIQTASRILDKDQQQTPVLLPAIDASREIVLKAK